ncbi:MAG: MarR family winged helix-turn-helix transcriptional regulator [Trueperaceae bacterium]
MAAVFDLNTQHQDIDSKIVAGLERLAQALRVLLWEEAKTHGLSPIQVQFLIYLNNHPKRDRSVSHLAITFDLTKATVSDAVTALETKGYITREKSSQDKRAAVLKLTSSGKQLAKTLEPWADTVKKQLEGLEEGERLELMISVMNLIASLQKTEVITIARMCRTCQFFQESSGENYFCTLLNQPLALKDLRLDCPEHQPSETV